MSEEILNLSTIVERSTVNITAKRNAKAKPTEKLYELRNTADIGPYEYASILHGSQEVERLRALKKLTAAQERQVKKLLDDTVKLVFMTPLEPYVLAALTEQQKEMIVFTWAAHVRGAAEGNAEPNRRSRRTTAASSRGSKRSTAATQKRGSTSQRGS
jgi:hypothetical protein